MPDAERPLALRIAGPGRVALDVRRSAPVIAYHGAPLRTLAQHRFANSAVLTAVRLESNSVFTARARIHKEATLPRRSEHAPEKVSGTEVHTLDLRECLNIPWKEGTYLVTLIMANVASNRIRVRLTLSDWVFRDPEVEKFIASHRRDLPPLPVWPAAVPGESLPGYRRLPDSPEVPAAIGIALKGISTGIIYGSFRTRITNREVVRQDSNKFAFLPATAVVPITLVLAHGEGGVQITVRVPSFSAIDSSASEQTVNGFFAIDLSKLEGIPQLPEKFFVYALSGEAFTGPVEFSPGRS
jgi:hypothetical protein